MVNVRQLINTLWWFQAAPDTYFGSIKPVQNVLQSKEDIFRGIQSAKAPKSIAIVGAGSAGLSAMKTFFDVADSVEQSWRLVAFEQRRDVGGVWCV